MRRGLIIGTAVAAVVAAAAIWYVFIRDDAPPELSLEQAVEGITGTTSVAPSAGTSNPPTTTVSTSGPSNGAAAPDGLDGVWVIDEANTIVGYRIGEELSGIGTAEAVGRTSNVTGSMTLNGSVLEAVSIEVDMTSLRSDSNSRDDQLRNRGLETDAFPSASFVLTSPVDLGSVPADGTTVSATATGDLTLHGVTRSVEIALDGTLVEGTIAVVGSLEVALADFDIEPPVGFRVLTIEDQGVFEVQLAFTR